MAPKNVIVLQYFIVPMITAIAVSLCAGGLLYGRLADLVALKEKGSDISALVVAKQCENHGALEFAFTDGDGPHRSRILSCTPRCDDVAIGSRFDIRYLKNDTDLVECGNLDEKINSQFMGLVFLLGVVLIVTAASFWQCAMKLKKRS